MAMPKDLLKEQKSRYYATNKHLRQAGLHKVALPGFQSLVVYSKRKFQVYSNSLPLNWLPNDVLQRKINDKLFQWQPFLEHKYLPKKVQAVRGDFIESTGGYTILSMQPYPFLVVDFDDHTLEEVEKVLVKEKAFWLTNDIPFSLARSLSGRGCHLHIWVDLSSVQRDRFITNPEMALFQWQYGPRFQVYKQLQEWFIKELEAATPLKACHNCIGSHLAYNPDEIGIINKFWKDKKPVQLPIANLEEFAAYNKKTTRRIQLEKRLAPFFDELQGFLLDGPYLEVSDWVAENCDMGTVDVEYYQKAMLFLRNNFATIKEHILENWDKVSLFSVKKDQLDVGVVDIQTRFFGVENSTYLTYIRRIFLYIFCLSKTSHYVFKKKVMQFCYTPNSEQKTFFKSSFLETFWFEKKTAVDFKNIASQIGQDLGNGQTFERLKYWVPLVISSFGFLEGLELLYEGLDLSCANDKNHRKKSIRRFAEKIDQRPRGKVLAPAA